MVEESNRVSIDEEIEYTRNLLSSVSSQLDRIQMAMAEIVTTIDVLANLKSAAASEGKISIGSGLFVRAEIKDPDTVIFPIGSGVFTDEKSEAAIEKLNANLKELSASSETLRLRRKELEGRINALGTIYNQMLQQQSGTQQNV